MNHDELQELRQKKLDAVLAEYLLAEDEGLAPDRTAFITSHPEIQAELHAYFEDQDRMHRIAPPPLPLHSQKPGESEEILPIGTDLGQYRLSEVIGQGGMGTVYKGVHLHLNRDVAIKVLPRHLAKDPEFLNRFKREARALARLKHPHIVPVHDMGVQDGSFYFIMEFIDGANLRQLMETGGLTPEKALSIIPSLCDALEYAHAEGVIHRDIKPENILIDREGRVRIADFGLARVLHGESDTSHHTRTNMLMGTFNYMAPEQKQSSAVDHRADIYALGVVVFEMLTGELPEGRFDPPSKKVELDVRIDDVVLRALQNKPESRYQRASQMGNDVSDVINNPPSSPSSEQNKASEDPPLVKSDAAEPRTVLLQDGESGDSLGEAICTNLRITAKSEEALEVRAWNRNEVLIEIDDTEAKKSMITNTSDRLILEIPDEDTVLYVPEDLPLDIDVPYATLTVIGMRSPVHLRPGEEEITIEDHDGPLEVARVKGGVISIHGMRSEDFHLHAQSGKISVSGMALSSGRGSIRTHEGDIEIGVRREHCSFSYDAHSNSGLVHDVLSRNESKPESRSAVGGGAARLTLTSHSGSIRIQPHDVMIHKKQSQEMIGTILWSCILCGFLIWTGVYWIAAVFLIIGSYKVVRLALQMRSTNEEPQ